MAVRRLSHHRITRRERKDGGFDFLLNGSPVRKRSEITRLEALAIPPAWQDVMIAESASAKVLALGVDVAGRVQTIYHPRFRQKQDRQKFERMRRFGRALPRLRARVDRDLRRRRLNQDRVVACVVRIIDRHLLRVGSPEYARDHHSYGATTLRRKHVQVTSTAVDIDFVGKSGKRQKGRIRDPRVARIMSQLQELPGRDIFQYFSEDGSLHEVRSRHVNAYVKRHLGREFSAKDFRTWGGTVAVATELLSQPADRLRQEESRRQAVRDAVAAAAERLGNTPAVTRSSYVDPRVLSAIENTDRFSQIQRWTPPASKYLTPEEQRTLKLLDTTPVRPPTKQRKKATS